MSSENKNKFLLHLPLCVFRSLGRGPAQNNSALFVRHRKKYRYFADFARIRHRPRTKEDKHGTGSLSCFIFDRAASFRRGHGAVSRHPHALPFSSSNPCENAHFRPLNRRGLVNSRLWWYPCQKPAVSDGINAVLRGAPGRSVPGAFLR